MHTFDDGKDLIVKAGTSLFSATPLKLGERYSAFFADQLKPGEKKIFYASGAPGLSVDVSIERIANSGGHYHGGSTNEPLAVGTMVPNHVTFTTPEPQNIPCTYTAPDTCGSVKVNYKFSNGDYGWQTLDIILVSGLLPIGQSTGIALKAPTPIHPSPYWADPAFIAKLKLLGEKYAAKTRKDIIITDATLMWGGRFDISAEDPAHTWKPPHAEHRNGRQADVRLRDMSDTDQKAFQDICAELGITTQIDNGNHWHIRLP